MQTYKTQSTSVAQQKDIKVKQNDLIQNSSTQFISQNESPTKLNLKFTNLTLFQTPGKVKRQGEIKKQKTLSPHTPFKGKQKFNEGFVNCVKQNYTLLNKSQNSQLNNSKILNEFNNFEYNSNLIQRESKSQIGNYLGFQPQFFQQQMKVRSLSSHQHKRRKILGKNYLLQNENFSGKLCVKSQKSIDVYDKEKSQPHFNITTSNRQQAMLLQALLSTKNMQSLNANHSQIASVQKNDIYADSKKKNITLQKNDIALNSCKHQQNLKNSNNTLLISSFLNESQNNCSNSQTTQLLSPFQLQNQQETEQIVRYQQQQEDLIFPQNFGSQQDQTSSQFMSQSLFLQNPPPPSSSHRNNSSNTFYSKKELRNNNSIKIKNVNENLINQNNSKGIKSQIEQITNKSQNFGKGINALFSEIDKLHTLNEESQKEYSECLQEISNSQVSIKQNFQKPISKLRASTINLSANNNGSHQQGSKEKKQQLFDANFEHYSLKKTEKLTKNQKNQSHSQNQEQQYDLLPMQKSNILKTLLKQALVRDKINLKLKNDGEKREQKNPSVQRLKNYYRKGVSLKIEPIYSQQTHNDTLALDSSNQIDSHLIDVNEYMDNLNIDLERNYNNHQIFYKDFSSQINFQVKKPKQEDRVFLRDQKNIQILNQMQTKEKFNPQQKQKIISSYNLQPNSFVSQIQKGMKKVNYQNLQNSLRDPIAQYNKKSGQFKIA